MALPAGRVGVKADQVDWQGNIKGSGGSDLEPRVDDLENQVNSFEFLIQDGKAGYKTSGADTFHPFNDLYVENFNIGNISSGDIILPFNPRIVLLYSNFEFSTATTIFGQCFCITEFEDSGDDIIRRWFIGGSATAVKVDKTPMFTKEIISDNEVKVHYALTTNEFGFVKNKNCLFIALN